MPTIEDYVTPTSIEVLYQDETGNTVDTDVYPIANRESFLRHVLRINAELPTHETRAAFRDFSEKLSWTTFYTEGRITFTDSTDQMVYTFIL